MLRARSTTLVALAATLATTASACVPVLHLAPALESRPRQELRLRSASDGNFAFGGFRVRDLHRGLRTTIRAGATTSLGSGVTAGVSAFSSWQPITFTFEGRRREERWVFRCQRYRDEQDFFAGLACDVGGAETPVYRVEIDPFGGRVLGIGNDTNLEVTTERAMSGSLIGAHVFAAADPIAAVRLQPDMALIVAADSARSARLGSALLAAALFAADD